MHLKFKRFHQPDNNFQSTTTLSFIGLLILLLTSVVISSSFTSQQGVRILIPRALTSDMIKDDNVIAITSENIIYLNGQVTTLKEMEEWLKKNIKKHNRLLIKANRRSSVGRIMEVWDLCRKSGIESIHLATNPEN